MAPIVTAPCAAERNVAASVPSCDTRASVLLREVAADAPSAVTRPWAPDRETRASPATVGGARRSVPENPEALDAFPATETG